jgi:hypothetical protein
LLTALGAFLIAVGLLIVPHDAGPAEWIRLMKTGFAEGTRTIIAFSFMAVGLLFAAAGSVIGMSRRSPAI